MSPFEMPELLRPLPVQGDPRLLTDPTWTPCEKISYPTKAEANRALDSCKRVIAERERATGFRSTTRTERRVYRCDQCRCWHLTSNPHRYWDAEEAA
jgi:predicted RNA-binding Zn-ribbon protein involved in translation (DUF1610 family)